MQPMSAHRVLGIKPHLRPERREQDGQSETEQPDRQLRRFHHVISSAQVFGTHQLHEGKLCCAIDSDMEVELACSDIGLSNVDVEIADRTSLELFLRRPAGFELRQPAGAPELEAAMQRLNTRSGMTIRRKAIPLWESSLCTLPRSRLQIGRRDISS
jgi:hypothetical protein